jgi:hypothetical protein
MKTETVLQKATIGELIKAGYTLDSHVMADICGDLEDVASGEVAAKLSWSDKAIRTIKQNSSIHKYCSILADKFNDAGLDMLAVLKVKEVSVPWSMDRVKDILWKGIQEAMFNSTSTTKLETDQVSKVYETMNRHTSQNLGVSVDFPNRFHGIKYDD